MNAREDKSLIKVNIDTDTTIARLYGVGIELSKRIVEYRNIHGYYKNPDDLAKVDGISLQLAITLSPQIDWQIPKQQTEIKERDVFYSVFWLVATLFNLWLIFSTRVPDINYSIDKYKNGINSEWTWIWIYISLGLSNVVVALITFSAFIQAYTLRTKIERLWFKVNIILGILLIIALTSVVLGNVTYYQFYSPDGWLPFLNPVNISSALSALAAVFLATPIFLFSYLENKKSIRKKLAQLYDFGFALSGVAAVLVSLFTNDIFPLGYRIFQFIIGVVYSYIGLQMAKYNSSMFDLVISYYQLDENKVDDSRIYWTNWINSRLPNPEEQKELQKILNENYPKSKFKSFLGWLILGAGGWLIVTSLSSVLDWIIQKGLNSFLP